ncbi:hypothetical protein [Metabacillus fastidiosus]|uniref:hypothetical protein n=1 Tax=Metabacillus fastidiosus TaxID=1458 RepID=UPI003D27BC75
MCNKENKDVNGIMGGKSKRKALKNKKNVIRPKVENGKVLLDRNNPHHRYIYNDGEY